MTDNSEQTARGIDIDGQLDPEMLIKLERELSTRAEIVGILAGPLAKDDPDLTAQLEKAIVNRDNTIATIVESDEFQAVLAAAQQNDEKLAELIETQSKLRGLLNPEEIAATDEIINARIEELKTKHAPVVLGIAGEAMKFAGLEVDYASVDAATNVQVIPEATNVVAVPDVLDESLTDELALDDTAEALIGKTQAQLKIFANGIRINNGQIIKFASRAGGIDYAPIRKHAVEYLLSLDEGQKVSIEEFKEHLETFDDVDPENMTGAKFGNVRSWLANFEVEGTPIFTHNGTRGAASKYGRNDFVQVSMIRQDVTHITERNVPDAVLPVVLPIIEEGIKEFINSRISIEDMLVLHGAIAHLIRQQIIDDRLPEYPMAKMQKRVSSLEEVVPQMSSEALSELRQEVWGRVTNLLESDDFLKIVEHINENDSRYVLVDYLSTLNQDQQEYLKSLVQATIVHATTLEKTQSYKGSIEPVSVVTSRVGTNNEPVHTARIDIAHIPTKPQDVSTSSNISHDAIVVTSDQDSAPEAPTTLVEDEVVELGPQAATHEVKRTKAQQNFYDAALPILDTVIDKIIDNNISEGASREKLMANFPNVFITSNFKSAIESKTVTFTRGEGVSYKNLLLLSLYAHQKLQSKMKNKSYKPVLEDLFEYFIKRINENKS